MKRGAEGGDGYGGPAKRHGKGSGSGVPKTKHAFKVLVPDGLAAGLLGSRGAMKEEIQNETGAKLVFSNRHDCFPGSPYRVLAIFSDEPSCIIRVFEWILPKIVDLGEDERKNPPKDGPELLGKEPGEYVFRFCVTKRMSSHIIGAAGANIKQIRADTGAKVFIDNNTQMDHQLCRVIGLPEQILPCLERINEYVQGECEDPDFYTAFASVVNFGENEAGGWSSQPPPRESKGGGGGGAGGKSWGGGGGKSWSERGGNSRGGGGGESMEGRGVVVPPPKSVKAFSSVDSDEDAEEVHTGPVQEEVDSIADLLSAFPAGTPRLQYSVACDLPAAQVGALVGKAGEYIKYVEEASGTSIEIEGGAEREADAPRPMTIVGPLLNCYTAHAMMLVKLRTVEAKEQEEARRLAEEQSEDPAVLKARIQELQAQLAKFTGQA